MRRIDHAQYFLMIARIVSMRATCPRRSVGAVLVKNNRIISAGYNGAPAGMLDCLAGGCLIDAHGHCVNTIHGEANAFARAREQGDSIYSTDAPCINCFKLGLAHNEHMKFYYLREYEDPARDMFVKEHGLERRLLNLGHVPPSIVSIDQQIVDFVVPEMTEMAKTDFQELLETLER